MRKMFMMWAIGSLFLVSCTFLTGTKKKDPITGEETYTEAAVVGLTAAISGILGLGGLGLAAARLARNAARARDGLMEANEDAIENADWSEINSAKSFKILLKAAQDSRDDSKLLKKTFGKWNKKREIKDVKAKT